ncbi:hypothetical protein KI387_044502, partial [Taxus chinensis]
MTMSVDTKHVSKPRYRTSGDIKWMSTHGTNRAKWRTFRRSGNILRHLGHEEANPGTNIQMRTGITFDWELGFMQ